MTQTIDAGAETPIAETVTFEDAIRARGLDLSPPATPSVSDEPAQPTLTTAPGAESQEPDTAQEDGADASKLPRRAIPKLVAENEELKLTKAELEQQIADGIQAHQEATAKAQQLADAAAKRQADFDTMLGSDKEFAELKQLAETVGARVGADPYATVTPEEQQQLAKYNSLLPHRQNQDLHDQKAWDSVLEVQRGWLGQAVSECPGVDSSKLEGITHGPDLYKHFYEAGAASKQAEIDDLKTHVKGLTTHANAGRRVPAAAGASGSPSAGKDPSEMTWEESIAYRMAQQRPSDE